MLWFNGRFKNQEDAVEVISIHLMLWFNYFFILFGKLQYGISIHLMLWFNKIMIDGKVLVEIFQYILCCGSTMHLFWLFSMHK